MAVTKRASLLCILHFLLAGCLSPPMLGPHGATTAKGGPVVVVPWLLENGERTPLRSVLAWAGEDIRIRMPGDGSDVLLRVSPGQNLVTVEDTASGRTAAGPYNQPIMLRLDAAALELTVEYP